MAKSMRVMWRDTLGGVDVLRVTTAIRPAPAPTEVPVQVHAERVDPLDGHLRPMVSETFPPEQAGEAHRLGETGRTTGKIVLTV